MKPYMLPLSTAVWPPKWFRPHNKPYVDKNGVINGVEFPMFKPGKSCDGLCRGRETCSAQGPESCEFLNAYYNQLCELDFDEVMRVLEKMGSDAKSYLKFKEEPVIVLMFHEKYDNPCSERVAVKRWFEERGVRVKEFGREE